MFDYAGSLKIGTFPYLHSKTSAEFQVQIGFTDLREHHIEYIDDWTNFK